jgi:hypothetical protein
MPGLHLPYFFPTWHGNERRPTPSASAEPVSATGSPSVGLTPPLYSLPSTAIKGSYRRRAADCFSVPPPFKSNSRKFISPSGDLSSTVDRWSALLVAAAISLPYRRLTSSVSPYPSLIAWRHLLGVLIIMEKTSSWGGHR